MKRLLRLFRHEHNWTVAWNDDDECACGMVRLWPSGVIQRGPAWFTPGKPECPLVKR